MRVFKIITESVSLDGVGQINITWDFDEEAYNEFLSDEGLENNRESFLQYIDYYVEFELELFDNDTYHHMSYETCMLDDLKDMLGDKYTEYVIKELSDSGEVIIETSELYNSNDFDANNPDELNQVAMKILNHGEYHKGCRGFILTNGVIVYTPAEHNQVSQIAGIEGTFDFIRKGNIRILNQSIDLSKPPTSEQRDVLRQVISSYSDEELYLDIIGVSGEASAHYYHPDWRFVMGEIDRYFSEGLKPQGRMNESVDKPFDGIEISGEPDIFDVFMNGNLIAEYSFKDSKAYPFIISDNELFVGDKGETHGRLIADNNLVNDLTNIFCNNKRNYDIEGRIWVGAKSNEFNYAVVSFWGTKNTSDIRQKIEELCRMLKVNMSKLVIVSEGDNGMVTPILFSEWNGRVHQASEEEDKAKSLHLLNSKEKHDNTDDFRNSRDKKIGQKLTNDNGDEMPMAKYHNLIYQESKGKRNITINEDQYNRLFNTRRSIKITEEQYNRMFQNRS